MATTEDQGEKPFRNFHARKVNLIKVWVDDRNGRAPGWHQIFRAIIDEGHKHGLQVNAHVFYYTDASSSWTQASMPCILRDRKWMTPRGVRRSTTSTSSRISPRVEHGAELPHWLGWRSLMTLLHESACCRSSRGCGMRTDAAAVERRAQHGSSSAALRGRASQREDHAWLRHRPRGPLVRHVRTARTGKHGERRMSLCR